MAEDSSGSNRDATRSRPRVQQLRPTNKDAPVPVPAVPVGGIEVPSAVSSDTVATSSKTASTTAQPRVVVPRIVTGQGSGSTILVNNCQVRRNEGQRGRRLPGQYISQASL
jgi:hypothetical protein